MTYFTQVDTRLKDPKGRFFQFSERYGCLNKTSLRCLCVFYKMLLFQLLRSLLISKNGDCQSDLEIVFYLFI